MNVGAAIVVFVLIWWCVFFIVLPFGVRGEWESDEPTAPGVEPGAPRDPNLRRKLLTTTIIAAPVWLLAMLAIASGVVNFRN